MMRGPNELTLGELWASGRWLPLHIRVALACSPLILGLVAFTIAVAARTSSRALVTGLAAHWPAALTAWTPNLIFAIATAGLLLLRSAKS
jgi:hypothetical protein